MRRAGRWGCSRHCPAGGGWEPGARLEAPGSTVERQIESKLAERDAMQQKMETQALNALNLAPVITKTAEVLAKHLREKIKKEPETRRRSCGPGSARRICDAGARG